MAGDNSASSANQLMTLKGLYISVTRHQPAQKLLAPMNRPTIAMIFSTRAKPPQITANHCRALFTTRFPRPHAACVQTHQTQTLGQTRDGGQLPCQVSEIVTGPIREERKSHPLYMRRAEP